MTQIFQLTLLFTTHSDFLVVTGVYKILLAYGKNVISQATISILTCLPVTLAPFFFFPFNDGSFPPPDSKSETPSSID